MRGTGRWPIALAAVGSLALAGAALWHFALARSVFVRDAGGARWLVAETRRWPGSYTIRPRAVGFRTVVRVDSPTPPVTLSLRAVEQAVVELDGNVIYRDDQSDPLGRVDREVPLGVLAVGEHRLAIYVLATASPPLLWARSDVPLVATGPGWEYSGNGSEGAWHAARLATDGPRPFPLSREFPHAGRAFAAELPVLLPLFLVIALLDRHARAAPSPAQLRWALIAAWCGLAANNLTRVPADLGMDLSAHLAYVVYIVEHFRIPLATQGHQMMQAPLAYLLYAPLFVILSSFGSADGVVQGMRILPMVCGAAQVELSYRAVRSVYPDRGDLQRAGILVGGLLPVNLYLAHAVGNEPVVALFGGIAAVAALDVAMRAESPSRGRLVGSGFALGLAILSKVTALFLAPALLFSVALRSYGRDRSTGRAVRGVAVVAGCAVAIAGWYYARNWLLLGTPFFGSWKPRFFETAWQEPGYRSASQYLRFGEALAHPIYAAVVGLWDGLYASLWLDGGLSGEIARAEFPPWNQAPLLAGAWLGLAPTALLVLGAVGVLGTRGARSSSRLCEAIALGTVALYLGAILQVHLALPVYSVAKASYLAATTPLLAVLIASGFSRVASVPALRALASAALVCWATNCIATYWVL